MWSTTRARLLEAEGASCSAEGDEALLQQTTNPSKVPTSHEETVEPATGRRSRKRTRRSTRKGEPPAKVDSGKSPSVRDPDLDAATEGLFWFRPVKTTWNRVGVIA